MKTRDLKVGDILTTYFERRYRVTLGHIRNQGVGIQSVESGERRTIFHDDLPVAWRSVERAGAVIWERLGEVKE